MYIQSRTVRTAINSVVKALALYPLAYPPIPEDNCIMFYNRDRKDFGFLSNFHPSPIEIDGIVYPDVEHYYQAQKSTDPDYRLAIMSASTPGKAKRLADSRVGHPGAGRSSGYS